MTTAIFIRTGHGYEVTETLNTHLQRCTAFDGFRVVAHPLPTRESRILGRDADGRNGTDYGSHEIRLAVDESESTYKRTRSYYLLMSHGSGREVLQLPTVFDRGVGCDALLALPEAALYAVLMTLYETARIARAVAVADTRREWARAHLEKRIKTTRRNNQKYVEIVPAQLAPATA